MVECFKTLRLHFVPTKCAPLLRFFNTLLKTFVQCKKKTRLIGVSAKKKASLRFSLTLPLVVCNALILCSVKKDTRPGRWWRPHSPPCPSSWCGATCQGWRPVRRCGRRSSPSAPGGETFIRVRIYIFKDNFAIENNSKEVMFKGFNGVCLQFPLMSRGVSLNF